MPSSIRSTSQRGCCRPTHLINRIRLSSLQGVLAEAEGLLETDHGAVLLGQADVGRPASNCDEPGMAIR